MFGLAGTRAHSVRLSNEQPGSLSSEWVSVVSLRGLDEGQILVKVEVGG